MKYLPELKGENAFVFIGLVSVFSFFGMRLTLNYTIFPDFLYIHEEIFPLQSTFLIWGVTLFSVFLSILVFVVITKFVDLDTSTEKNSYLDIFLKPSRGQIYLSFVLLTVSHSLIYIAYESPARRVSEIASLMSDAVYLGKLPAFGIFNIVADEPVFSYLEVSDGSPPWIFLLLFGSVLLLFLIISMSLWLSFITYVLKPIGNGLVHVTEKTENSSKLRALVVLYICLSLVFLGYMNVLVPYGNQLYSANTTENSLPDYPSNPNKESIKEYTIEYVTNLSQNRWSQLYERDNRFLYFRHRILNRLNASCEVGMINETVNGYYLGMWCPLKAETIDLWGTNSKTRILSGDGYDTYFVNESGIYVEDINLREGYSQE